MNDKIISICIPTYNRCEILDKTLMCYVSDLDFDERTEIVISDNCSTDNTKSVVEKYIQSYKNIRYNRLDENIGADLNILKALEMGRGKYLKLTNDTVFLNPGVLKFFIETILSSDEDQPLFFYQNITFLNNNTSCVFNNLNELISNVSFFITWITNFGSWYNHFVNLNNKTKDLKLQFMQSDWTLRILNEHNSSKIYFADYYHVQEVTNKGGYNIFKTFTINYFALYEEYLLSGDLSQLVFNMEKKRLLKYFLIHWYGILILNKKNKYTFNSTDAFNSIYNIYKYEIYFYIYIVLIYCKYFILKKFIKNDIFVLKLGNLFYKYLAKA